MPWRIKNWHEYQHYKHRAPPWIKLYKRLLIDREWHALSGDDSKMLAMCWLIASDHASGGILPKTADLAFILRIKESEVDPLMKRLSHWVEQDASSVLADCKQDASNMLDRVEESRVESDASIAPTPAPQKRGSRLPDDWTPSQDNLNFAIGRGFSGLPLQDMAANFRGYWLSVPGQKGLKLNWDMTWENWVRSQGKPKQPGNGHSSKIREGYA